MVTPFKHRQQTKEDKNKKQKQLKTKRNKKKKKRKQQRIKLGIIPYQTLQQTELANVFTSLLPVKSDHAMINLGSYNCSVCTYSHATSCM